MIKGLLLSFLILLQSCGGEGTTVGNPITVNLKVSSYNTVAWYQSVLDKILVPKAHAAVSSVYFCIKRARFKLAAGSSDISNIDLSLGEVQLVSTGTDLDQFDIPEAIYRRIELDLNSDCGKSVRMTNNTNTFETTDSITLKFEGNFDASGGQIILPIQDIIDALDVHNGSQSLKDTLESVVSN